MGGFNWEQIYLDPVERGSLVNAATLFIFFSIIPVALGLSVVSLLARTRRRGMGVFRVIFFLPQVLVTDRHRRRVDLDPGTGRNRLFERHHPLPRARACHRTCMARGLQHRSFGRRA